MNEKNGQMSKKTVTFWCRVRLILYRGNIKGSQFAQIVKLILMFSKMGGKHYILLAGKKFSTSKMREKIKRMEEYRRYCSGYDFILDRVPIIE